METAPPLWLADKNWWRQENRAVRRSIPERMRAVRSRTAVDRLLETPLWQETDSILAYVPIRDELDVRPLHAAALDCGKRLIVPRVEGPSLGLYQVTHPQRELIPSGNYRIPEPDPAQCRRLSPDEPIGLAILPGLAFDVRGVRIGYGGGYFDRLLAAHPMRTVGIAFAAQLTARLPTETHDIHVECVVTESQIYQPNQSRGETHSPEETHRLGRRLGEAIHGPLTILFEGGLAAGKTTCVQGILGELGVEGPVTSPSFVYERQYEVARGRFRRTPIRHIDLYRLPPPSREEPVDSFARHHPDLAAALDSESLCLVEWPERLGVDQPIDAARLTLKDGSGDTREWSLETVTETTLGLHDALDELTIS